ncbi:MAG: hypothetical protein COV69_04155 [Parcubacteria group bacterium CG11_big_fil_rev_8_21_14_0_20_39_14]|nr:MAG: hypothetical protein COV69_04155 [Parcubacteria group bacterium CG11_big_fil_rev_8_21_14_0_20_39_14]PIS35125.1 MAG: hypothetical protein COT36_04205 [Parcubacteria group bacterium CG08_land_8_20_14_0_20_38_56]
MNNNLLKTVNKFLIESVDVLRRYYTPLAISVFGLSLIIAGFVFYQYFWLVVHLEPGVKEKELKIKEDVYKAVLENIEQREKDFLESKNKNFPDIF